MGIIYKISNTKNDKIYIGQTVGTLNKRWKEHIYAGKNYSNNSTQGCYLLARAMSKYGIENFSISIIELCPNNNLDEKEQYWIKKENSLAPSGYNLTLGGAGHRKYDQSEIINYFLNDGECNCTKTAKYFNCHTQTVSNILSSNNIPISRSGEHWESSVYQIDINNFKIINQYKSTTEASIKTGYNYKTICAALVGNQKSAYNFLWSYANLKDYNKTTQDYRDFRKKGTICVDNGFEFISKVDAVKWLKEINPNLTGSISGMSANIGRAEKNNIKAYGFLWKKN